jgi:hypothetical protein
MRALTASTALRGARVPMTMTRRNNRVNRRAAFETRARVNWVLDRDNCGSARSDDDGTLFRNAPQSCLAVPIDVNALVDLNKGELEFEDEGLRFECVDAANELVVMSLKGKTMINGKKIPKNKKTKLQAGARLKVGNDGEEFVLYRNAHAHA